jgi:S-formylglutathione hydrolase FrmB
MRSVHFSAVIPAERPLPPAAPPARPPYRTLYLLHGIFGSHLDWVCGSRVASLAQELGVAVVMPAGENKFYVDNEASFDNHGAFVGRELVAFTRALFPLSKKREDTAIAGLSMGGYGALRNGLKYADTFGHIAALSAALILESALKSSYDEKNILGSRAYFESVFGDLEGLADGDKDVYALVKKRLAAKKPLPRIYAACGTEDFLVENNRAFSRFLSENNVEHTYEEGPGGHDWAFWDAYIERVLKWL